jgi:hypothetical protein
MRLLSTDGLPVQIVKDQQIEEQLAPRRHPAAGIPDVVASKARRHRASAHHVELMGIEPTASGLQNRRSPS